MRRALYSAVLLCVCPMIASQAQPVALSAPLANPSAFEDRSAPSTYKYDELGAAVVWKFGAETMAVSRFEAVGGADLLSTISGMWFNTVDGQPARVFVWQDTNGSGDPRQAKLVHEQAGTVQLTGTGNYVVYTLSKPVAVTGTFFIGVSTPTTAFSLPSTSEPIQPGRFFLFGTPTPPLDAGNLAESPYFLDLASYTGSKGVWKLRATGAGSSFAYQGRLSSGGQNYSGSADLIVTVYDSAEGGSVVGSPAAIANVPVSAGVFSVQVPSEPSWFVNSADRYLGVQVRTPATGGGGADGYTALTPRQRIGQVPAAMVATVSQSTPWSGLTGVPASLSAWGQVPGGIGYSGGLIGIGTANPVGRLHVSGGPGYHNVDVESAFTDGTWLNLFNTSPNGRWWSLISTGSTNSEGAGALLIRDNSVTGVRAAFLPNGRVGLGTTTPQAELDVRGEIRMGAAGEFRGASANAENLTLIRGNVNSDGTIRAGAGFTVARSGFGLYRVSYPSSPGFSGTPTPVATAYLAGGPVIVYVIGASFAPDRSGYVDFRTSNLNGVLVDSAFSFTLTGPR